MSNNDMKQKSWKSRKKHGNWIFFCSLMIFSMVSSTFANKDYAEYKVEQKSDSNAYWVKNNTGWWYKNADGSYPYNKWEEINGKWYYFNESGYCVINTWIGNYYLGSDGAMLVDTTTPDGYKVDKNGKWISENGKWVKNNIGWWYENADGSYPYNKWEEINGKWYYFNESGYCVINTWIDVYYLGSDGAMLVDTITPDGYKVDKNGKWIPDLKINNEKQNQEKDNTNKSGNNVTEEGVTKTEKLKKEIYDSISKIETLIKEKEKERKTAENINSEKVEIINNLKSDLEKAKTSLNKILEDISLKQTSYDKIRSEIKKIENNIPKEELEKLDSYKILQMALSKLEDAKNKEENAIHTIDILTEDVNTLKNNVNENQESVNKLNDYLENTKKERDNVKKEIEEKVNLISTTNNKKEKLLQELEKANFDVETKRKEYNEAKKQIDKTNNSEKISELLEQIKKAEANKGQIDQMIEDGAISFLQWITKTYPEYKADAEEGLYILNEWKNKGIIQTSTVGDASSYEKLLKTADYLEENNRLRLEDNNFPNLEKQETNFSILAMSLVSTNRSIYASKGHLHTFKVAECLAWGHRDPFIGWYKKEKVYYDFEQKFIENYLKEHAGVAESEAKEKAVMARKEKFGEYTSTGHYEIMMSKDYQIVAIGENTIKGSNEYGSTHGLNSTWKESESVAISEEKYREIIEAYKVATDKAKAQEKIDKLRDKLAKLKEEESSSLNVIAKTVESKKKQLDEAIEKTNNIKKELDTIANTISQLQNEKKNLNNELTQLEQTIIVKENSLEQANRELSTSNSLYKEKSTQLREAETNKANAVKEKNLAETNVKNADKALSDEINEKFHSSLTELSVQANILDKEIKKLKEEKEKISTEITNKENLLRTAKENATESQANLEALNAQIQKLKDDKSELEKRLKEIDE